MKKYLLFRRWGRSRGGEGTDEKPFELAKEVGLPFFRITTILTFLSLVQEVEESKIFLITWLCTFVLARHFDQPKLEAREERYSTF